jgi:hypothetical protein
MTDTEKLLAEVKAELLPFESWERLTGESAAAYTAFCAFRDYGPERNIRRAVEGHFRKAECPYPLDTFIAKKYRMWRNWSTAFRWRERAADYDAWLDKLKQTEVRKAIEAQGEAQREALSKMLAKASKGVDLTDPAGMKAETIRDWLETSIRLDRELSNLGILAAGKGNAAEPEHKPGSIQFIPEFEGL